MTLWRRIVSGDGLRRTRLHDYDGCAVGLAALGGLPRAAATAGMLKAFEWRPERPWLGYSAIRCIEHLLQPHWRLLEFGSGQSTVWFARRVSEMVSIETNAEWHQRVKTRLVHRGLSERVDIRLVPADLAGVSATLSRDFDFALVDGAALRHMAAALAVAVVKPGGYVYLDNSDGLSPDHKAARQLLVEACAPDSRPRFFTDFCDGQVGVTQGLLVQTATPGRDGRR